VSRVDYVSLRWPQNLVFFMKSRPPKQEATVSSADNDGDGSLASPLAELASVESGEDEDALDSSSDESSPSNASPVASILAKSYGNLSGEDAGEEEGKVWNDGNFFVSHDSNEGDGDEEQEGTPVRGGVWNFS